MSLENAFPLVVSASRDTHFSVSVILTMFSTNYTNSAGCSLVSVCGFVLSLGRGVL
jgi:hypothetical protein